MSSADWIIDEADDELLVLLDCDDACCDPDDDPCPSCLEEQEAFEIEADILWDDCLLNGHILIDTPSDFGYMAICFHCKMAF